MKFQPRLLEAAISRASPRSLAAARTANQIAGMTQSGKVTLSVAPLLFSIGVLIGAGSKEI